MNGTKFVVCAVIHVTIVKVGTLSMYSDLSNGAIKWENFVNRTKFVVCVGCSTCYYSQSTLWILTFQFTLDSGFMSRHACSSCIAMQDCDLSN